MKEEVNSILSNFWKKGSQFNSSENFEVLKNYHLIEALILCMSSITGINHGYSW